MTQIPINGLPALDIHRQLPRDVQSEQALLSVLVQKWTLLDELQVRSDWFTPAHQIVIDEIAQLGELTSFSTLVVSLRDHGKLEHVGGAGYLAEITSEYVSPAQAHYFADKVRDAFIRREVIRISMEAATNAYIPGPNHGVSLVTDLEQGITKLVADIETRSTGEQSFKDMVMEAIEEIDRAYTSRGAIQGLPSGIKALDRLTGGFRNKHLIVIAARPSEGKTALGLHIADTCLTAKIPVGFISMEMPGRELAERLLSRVSLVDSALVRDGLIKPHDFPKLTAASAKLQEYPLYIDDRSGLTIAQVASKARTWRRQHGIRVLIIDYLQLMRSGSKRASDNRQIEVAEISSGCKAIAKELDIPVIVMAQLNRAPEQGGTIRKPRLSDLRESGAIEADADAVILLQRKYEKNKGKDGQEEEARETNTSLRDIHLILAKQRNGPIGEINLQFACPFHTFREISTRSEQ